MLERLRIRLHHTRLARLLDCLRGDHDTILVAAHEGSAYQFKHRCRFCLHWTPDDRVWQMARRGK